MPSRLFSAGEGVDHAALLLSGVTSICLQRIDNAEIINAVMGEDRR